MVRAVKEVCDIPIIVKLTPDQSRPLDVARRVREAGADAVTATNRYTGFVVDIETGQPRLAGPAGIGGPWTKPLSLRWVHRIYTELGMPITGSNGVYDHRDIVEFIMTGAGIVQIGSVLMIKGIKWLAKVVEGLEKFMDGHGYADVASMHGDRFAAGGQGLQRAIRQAAHSLGGQSRDVQECNLVHDMHPDLLL